MPSSPLSELTSLINEIAPNRPFDHQQFLLLPGSLRIEVGLDPVRLMERKSEFIRLSYLVGLVRFADQGDLAAFCRTLGDIESFSKAWQIGLSLGLWQNRAEHALALQKFLQSVLPS